jgi:proline iminopeptidase
MLQIQAPQRATLPSAIMYRKRSYSIVFALLGLVSCNQYSDSSQSGLSKENQPYEIKTGGVKMIEIAGGYRVWTKKIGNGQIKVLLLHGGPGFSHDYLECFEDFLPQEGIEFYYYDQLGTGNSDVPSDTTFWNLFRYVDEVEQVRKGLNLEDFYLYGHSWGSMLAMEYLHKYQRHVKGAVLSNMTASMDSFKRYTTQQKNEILTSKERAVFDSLDKRKLYDSAEYQDLLMTRLYTRTICRMPVEEWPEPLLRAFKKSNQTIYRQMQGVDEFHVTGNFKDWDMWAKLPSIEVPTLVLGGVYDEMDPEDMKREGRLIPNSRTYLCPNGSHLSMYDDQTNYFSSLVSFLKEVEARKFTPDKKL